MISNEIQSLSDEQLRSTLEEYSVTVGPITNSTRKLYERKLARLRQELPAVKLFSDEEKDDEQEEIEQEEMEEEEMKNETNVPLRNLQFSNYSTQFTPTYTSSPGINSSNLIRRPLNSRFDQDQSSYTSLRKPGVSSSAVPAKAGLSWYIKLLIVIVLGFMLWMIFMNFEYKPSVPSLTSTD